MEWLEALRGRIVGLDSAPLIYFVEEHPDYLSLVDPFFEAMVRGELQVVTSTLTLAEVLVHPLRHRKPHLLQQYSSILLNSRFLKTLPATAEISIEAAQIRAAFRLKTPHAAAFLTNDDGIAELPGLRRIVLKHLSKAS